MAQCLPNRRRTPTRWMSQEPSRVTMTWRLLWRWRDGARCRAGGGSGRGSLWHRRHLWSRAAHSRHRVASGCAVGGIGGGERGCVRRRGVYCRRHGGDNERLAPAARQRKQRPSPDHALAASGTPETPVLLRIAGETRRALAATLRRLRPNERWDIDITIDDLRDTDAGASSGA